MAELGYWRALVGATGPLPVARAALRKLGRRGLTAPGEATASEATAAAAALGGRKSLLPVAARTARALYRLALPGAAARARARAEAILGGRVELFGVAYRRAELDWHLDPASGRRFDPTVEAAAIDVLAPGADPRVPWELARGAHLVEAGVAARLFPDLAPAARRLIVDEIESFLDGNPPGRGVHWAAPLEAAVRVAHWLGALELAGVLTSAPWAWRRRFGAALVAHGRFLAANVEDAGVVAGNHVLGELAALLHLGLLLDGAAEATRWRDRALATLPGQAERQVLDDGASFEGSTAYHRFVLEILFYADRVGAAWGRDLGLAPTLKRMFRFVAATLGPDGRDAGFGDRDDGRLLPLAAREPRDHGYLLALGAARFGDPACRPPGAGYSEEAALWLGAAGWRRFRTLPSGAPPATASFPSGGVHVLRGAAGDWVALRAGGHGQRGVGGHSHNDQLALAVALDGVRLVDEPGTLCYGADPLWRDRFRGTAAHATAVLDGAEQAPLWDGRLFALPARGRSRLRAVEERWPLVRAIAARGPHQREVQVDAAARAVVVIDRFTGDGSVEVRWPLAEVEVAPAAPDDLAFLDGRRAPSWAGQADRAAALRLLVGGRTHGFLIPLGATGAPTLDRGWRAPRWGERRPSTVIRFPRLRPAEIAVAFALAPAAAR